jgi:hypothetical protein
MLNKRGQGLSTNAIILIVLGVLVLVVLLVGFYSGWSKFAPWIQTDNVGATVTQCGIACNSANQYDFCSRERTLKADDLPTGDSEMAGTCEFFANEADYTKYGVAVCPSLC